MHNRSRGRRSEAAATTARTRHRWRWGHGAMKWRSGGPCPKPQARLGTASPTGAGVALSDEIGDAHPSSTAATLRIQRA